MAKVITVAQTKGGVGKTTLALQIAFTLASQGKRVWLVDGDRQRTSQTAVSLRPETLPPVACASYEKGSLLRSQVLLQKGSFDVVIIDVGGADSSAMRASLTVSDAMVVPFQPRAFDVWALGELSSVIDEVSGVRGSFPAYAVLNCADTRGDDNEGAITALEDFPALSYLPCPIGRRKAIAVASCSGLSVCETRPRDPKAVAEVTALVNALFEE